MKTRKKLLIALLSATCLTAGAFGFAACKDSGGDTKDPVLYGIYNAYVAETDNPLSYEDWLKDKLSSSSEKGEQGEPGNDGKSAYELYQDAAYAAGETPMTQAQWLASLSGVTPHVGENGNWYLGSVDTGVKAAGTNGTNGVGVAGVAMSEDGKSLVVSFTSGDPVNVPLPDFITHKHTYGNEYTVIIPSTGDVEGLGYKKCTGNGCDHYELYVIPCYSYRVTVYLSDAQGEEVGSITGTPAAGAKVSLYKGEEKVAEATTDENGEAIFDGVEKGEYNIVVEKEGYISFAELEEDFAEGFGTTSANGVDYVAMLVTVPEVGNGGENTPYEITTGLNSEVFYIERGADNTYVKFTATKGGAYTFANSRELAVYDENWAYYEDGVMSAILNAGESVTLLVNTIETSVAQFMLSVSYEKADEGSIYLPVSVGSDQHVQYSAKNNEEVYFQISKPEDATKVKITYNSANVTVYAVGVKADGSQTLLSSGDYVDYRYTENWGSEDFPWYMTFDADYYYIVASAENGNIEFVTETYALEGEKANPVEIEGAGTFSLSTAPQGATEMWYKLEAGEDTSFIFDQSANDSNATFNIYVGIIDLYNPDYYLSSNVFGLDVKAGVTYYVRVLGFTESDAFTVSGYSEQYAGLLPSHPKTAGADVETAAGLTYYKYTAENAGFVVITTTAESPNLIVYTDETFGEAKFYFYNNQAIEVAAGESIYFTCNDDEGTMYNIENIAAAAKVDYTLTLTDTVLNQVVAGVKVKLMNGEEVAGEATTDAEGVAAFNISAGAYDIVVDFTDEQKELYGVSVNSPDSVSLLNKNVNVILRSAVSYQVTIEGLDGLESTEGVSAVLSAGTRGSLSINWQAVQTVAVTGNTVTFDKITPTAQFYKVELSGLPKGYNAEEVNIQDGTIAYTITITGSGSSENGTVDWGRLTDSKEVVITERTTFTFTLPEAPEPYDYDCWIDIEGGYIESLTDSSSTQSIQNGNESNVLWGFDSWSSRTVTFVVVPTGGETKVIFTFAYAE